MRHALLPILVLGISLALHADEPSGANVPQARMLARTAERAAADALVAARKARKTAEARELVLRLEELTRASRSLARRLDRSASVREVDNDLTELERTAGRVDAAAAEARAGAAVMRPVHQAEDSVRRLRAIATRTDGSGSAAPASAAPGAERSEAPLAREEIAALAADVDERMALARQAANRFADSNPGYSAELVKEIDRLSGDASDLRRTIDSGRYEPRDVRAFVDGLLVDARAAAELMRVSNAFTDMWGGWDSAIAALARMTELLPRL